MSADKAAALIPAAAAALSAAEHLTLEGWSTDAVMTTAPSGAVVMRVHAVRGAESVAISVVDPDVSSGAIQAYVAGSPPHALVRAISGRHLGELACSGPHSALSNEALSSARTKLVALAGAAGGHRVAAQCAELGAMFEPDPVRCAELVAMADAHAGGAPISWVLAGA